MSAKKQKNRILYLPSADGDPKMVLHQIMNQPAVRAVTVIVINEDNTCECRWSKQTTADLSFALLSLQREVMHELEGK
jgi:hypothetical protein